MSEDDPLLDAIKAATATIAAANKLLEADTQDGDRTTRFLRRLDQFLTPMSELGQRTFLIALLDVWERRYAQFICAASDPDDADATDFLLTIVGVSARLSALEGHTDAATP